MPHSASGLENRVEDVESDRDMVENPPFPVITTLP